VESSSDEIELLDQLPPRPSQQMTRAMYAQQMQQFASEVAHLENPKIHPIGLRLPFEAQHLDMVQRDLREEVLRMREQAQSDSSDPEDEAIVIEPEPAKAEDDRTYFFKLPDGSEVEKILRNGQTFGDLMRTFPEEFRHYSIVIGSTMPVQLDLMGEMYEDYTTFTMIEGPKMRKLTFAFPNGERKKVMVDVTKTFRDAAAMVGVHSGRLMFDGDYLSFDQIIGENKEIEDGDQIDVKNV
jgi:hypothetical protein